MKNWKYQIKDISDEDIYIAIRESNAYYTENCFKIPTPFTRPGIALSFKFPYDFLLQFHMKLVLAKMQKMVDEGKLECGVSLRTAWIVGEKNYFKKEEKNE